MDTPIHRLPIDPPCHAGPAARASGNSWLRALLRIFADMACRLR